MPRTIYASNAELREAIDLIERRGPRQRRPRLFRPLVESLLDGDEYLLFADYQAYVDCQERVSEAYRDPESWTRMSILNCARVAVLLGSLDPRVLPRHLDVRRGRGGAMRPATGRNGSRVRRKTVDKL